MKKLLVASVVLLAASSSIAEDEPSLSPDQRGLDSQADAEQIKQLMQRENAQLVKRLARQFDRDGDGQLNQKEMQAMRKAAVRRH